MAGVRASFARYDEFEVRAPADPQPRRRQRTATGRRRARVPWTGPTRPRFGNFRRETTPVKTISATRRAAGGFSRRIRSTMRLRSSAASTVQRTRIYGLSICSIRRTTSSCSSKSPRRLEARPTSTSAITAASSASKRSTASSITWPASFPARIANWRTRSSFSGGRSTSTFLSLPRVTETTRQCAKSVWLLSSAPWRNFMRIVRSAARKYTSRPHQQIRSPASFAVSTAGRPLIPRAGAT